MPIDFEPTPNTQAARAYYRTLASEQMRPISRKYDDREHELPVEWVDYYWKHGREGPKSGTRLGRTESGGWRYAALPIGYSPRSTPRPES